MKMLEILILMFFLHLWCFMFTSTNLFKCIHSCLLPNNDYICVFAHDICLLLSELNSTRNCVSAIFKFNWSLAIVWCVNFSKFQVLTRLFPLQVTLKYFLYFQVWLLSSNRIFCVFCVNASHFDVLTSLFFYRFN